MSRFFKSAAFPILIVVVLAFFAQKLISPGESTKKPTFSQFLHQIDGGQVKSATLKTKDNTVDVTLLPILDSDVTTSACTRLAGISRLVTDAAITDSFDPLGICLSTT